MSAAPANRRSAPALTPALIHAAGTDVGNRSMRAACRSVWSRSDHLAAIHASVPLWRAYFAARRQMVTGAAP